MKFSILFIAVVLLGCSKSSDPKPTQLLTNSDMESGEFNNPSSWSSQLTGGTNYKLWWATDAFYSGNHSLEIACSTMDITNYAYWVQGYNSSSLVGKNLVFSVKIKGVNLSGRGASIVINGDSGSGAVQYVWMQTKVVGDFDWTTYQVTLPTSVDKPVNNIYVYLVMLTGTTGTVYFDDAKLMVDSTI